MRTTIAIDDRLLQMAKSHAAARGQTLGSYVEDALRLRFAAPSSPAPVVDLPVFTRGTGPGPGVDLASNRGLYDALDASGDLS